MVITGLPGDLMGVVTPKTAGSVTLLLRSCASRKGIWMILFFLVPFFSDVFPPQVLHSFVQLDQNTPCKETRSSIIARLAP